MANHGILIPEALASTNVDSFNRSVVSTVDLDNGNVVVLSGKSSTAGEGEVWSAYTPSTGSGLTGLWMIYGDEIVVTDSKYKGLNPDPRSFYTASGKVVSAFKPQLGDIIVLTTDALSGSYVGSGSVTTHINASNSGGIELVWGTSQTASVLSFALVEVTYVSIGSGAIDSQRETAYRFECVGL